MSLAGLSVLDLSNGVAGPYCARLLADYGADVLKIESPSGDPTRAVPTPGLFAYLNFNKRGVRLDLASASDRAALRALSMGADVLVESSEPGTLATLGLSPEALLHANPRLVVTSITPFGQCGPYAHFRAPEVVLEALAGWLAGNGDPDREPLKMPGDLQAHLYGGLVALVATLGALRRQHRTGRGGHVDVSTQEAVLYTLPNVTTIAQYSGQNWQRRASYPSESPPMGIYPCADGLIGCSAAYESEWAAFCRLIERDDLVADPRFRTRADRTRHAAELACIIEGWTLRQRVADVYQRGQALKVPIAPINTPADLLDWRQLRARGYWALLDQPDLGHVVVPGAPFKLPSSPWRVTRPAPGLGEHNADVLGRWGRPNAGVVGDAPQVRHAGDRPRRGDQPLAGVRVLDLSMAWAGPLATRLLAALGAEVIKIEGPQHMDRWRGGSIASDKLENYPDRRPGEQPYNRYALANTQNVNKSSLVLDLKQPGGREVFKQLVAAADLVVENFSAGAMQRLGLDHPQLQALNSRVVLVSLPALGRDGPERDVVGHANFVEDAAGNTFLFGYRDGPPLHTGTAWGDPIAGVTAAAAALMALLDAEACGSGQHVDVSHVEAAIPFNVQAVLEYVQTGRTPPRSGNEHATMAPHGVFRCQGDDRWIAIAVDSDAEWRALVGLMGNPAWALDGRFVDRPGRRAHRAELEAHLQSWTSSMDDRAAMHLLQAGGVAAGAVLNAHDVCSDPHLAARGVLVELDHPAAGRHRYQRPPWRFVGSPDVELVPAPLFGEHNQQVLGRLLGLGQDDVRALEAARIVASEPLPQYGV